MQENDTIYFEYPEQLLNEGYPTSEALDYIRNWSIIWGRDGNVTKTGEYFGKGKHEELIEYIRSIWAYNDTIVYEDGLLEIHTVGWSGNEDIIEELRKTDLWLIKFRCHQTGGHYFFQLEDKGYTWQVNKIEDK